MKTAPWLALLLVPCLLMACRDQAKKEEEKDSLSGQVRFSPEEGERWVYQVEVRLDPDARTTKGVVESGPEGAVSDYLKERVCLGLKQVVDGSSELAHCFQVSEGGNVRQLEFILIDDKGISTRAWQESGRERILMNPIVLIPSQEPPGATWAMSLPNPNDPGGDPMFSRQFRYFGLEKLQVLGEDRSAHRVKVVGRTGALLLQRDFWFVDQLGIVKERKAYYSEEKRVALVEEELTEYHPVQ